MKKKKTSQKRFYGFFAFHDETRRRRYNYKRSPYGFDGGDGGRTGASNLFYYVIVIITIIITEKK